MPDRTCSIAGCTKAATKRGWCPGHYWRWKNHGGPTAGGTAKGALPAFIAMAAASDTDDCILWPFALTPSGYGMVRALNTTAHRAVLEAVAGPAPGMDAAHAPVICHTPACVNPRHLRWATRSDNLADTVPDDTHRRGERAITAKLTNEQVLAIRADGRSGVAVAGAYGVSESLVSLIRNRKRWAWLD